MKIIMSKTLFNKFLKIILCLLLLTSLIGQKTFASQNTASQNTSITSSDEKKSKKIVKELSDRRKIASKEFLLEDGSIQANFYSNAIHYEDEKGRLQDIDTQFVDEALIVDDHDIYSKEVAKEVKEIARKNNQKKSISKEEASLLDSDYRALKVPFNIRIPKDYRKGYTMSKGTDRISLVPINANRSKGSLSSSETNVMYYPNVWKDTDVRLSLESYGIKETIYLKSKNAPTQFSYRINKKLDSNLSSGQLQIDPMWFEDASGTHREIQPVIEQEANHTLLKFEIDTTNLSYPIIIDPTITDKTSKAGLTDSYVANNTGSGINFGTSTQLQVMKNANGDESRTYIDFEHYSTFYGLRGKIINSAKLSLFLKDNREGTPGTANMTISRVTSSWLTSTLVWGNKPSDTSVNSVNFIAPLNGYGWVDVDVTQMVTDMYAKNEFYGFVIKPQSGYFFNLWFHSSKNTIGEPVLTINYFETANDTAQNSLKIYEKINYRGYLSNSTDVEYFTFTALRNGDYCIGMKPPSNQNIDMKVYDSSSNELMSGSNPTSDAELLNLKMTAGQTITIKLFNNGSTSFSMSSLYRIRISNLNYYYYVYDSSNRLVELYNEQGIYRNSTLYTYDFNGNLKSKITNVKTDIL
ncbi:DNRLRE domain-containing protein [Paenibacillus glycanilyticus]|uniref:Carbohydrate-binding module family 96 domain-containing protein n=1 Tax=Paenibacillus glycanilyticus TaxID=126569 RepID=A0ABQ6G5C6_9BACL|nr:DNRLRE domain-containing protein [Paenibacillus glycanilyticus]GLX65670.1 hypothetical protein MU1_00140 [Paenibacillus glycanilyticus]